MPVLLCVNKDIIKFYDQVNFEIIFKGLILSKALDASRYGQPQRGAIVGTRPQTLENLKQF